MSVRIIQNSFVSGELSPELWGRHDIKAYFNGASEIRNFIARRTGGLRKRAGTEVIYELTASTGQVGKRFVTFPYLYDSSSGGVLYLYAIGTEGSLMSIYGGFITVDGETVNIVAPALLPISSTLNIRRETDLAGIRAKQIGDTLFFTRNRKTAFKCAVTYSATPTLSFSMMQQSGAVPKPEELLIKDYKFRGYDVTGRNLDGSLIKETWGYVDSLKKYALYGVKDGIFSEPAKAEKVVTSPWTAGAYIELSFYPRWDLYDYYVLAKMNGSQYGRLGEFYPDANQGDTQKIDFTGPTGADAVGPTKTFRESLPGDGFLYMVAPRPAPLTGPQGVDAKLKGDPNALTADEIEIELSKYASIYLSTIDESTNIRTAILPQFIFPSAFPGGRAHIRLGGIVRNADDQTAETVSYAGMHLRVTPFNYTAAGVTFYTPQLVTVDDDNIVKVALSLAEIQQTYGPTEEDPAVIAADGAVKHIGFKIEYFVGDGNASYRFFLDNCIVLSGVAFDNLTSGGRGAPIACTAQDSFCYAMDDTAPEATYSTASEFNAVTSITCSLNKFSGTEYTAISTNDRWFDGFATEVISTSNGTFHTNSLAVKGDIFVTWTGGAPTAMQIWPGAIMQHSDGSEASPSPLTDPCTLTVSQKAGGTWHEIWSGSIARAYWTTPQTKDISTVAPNGTTEFKFNFSTRTVIRGLTLIGQGKLQVFKDDNIAAGTITGIQERLTVGDTGMDCRVMDLFQQRLVMASSDNLPFSMWFSNVGDLYNFYANRPQTDSDAFSVTIPATRASKILHIVSGKWLTLFTESGEYVCDPGAEGLSYRSISIKQVSSVGIHPNVEPIQTEDRMVFVAHDGRSVYEMRYDLQQDSVIPVDRSILAYHLTEGATIIKAAYQRFPDSVIWFLLSDGTLLSLTFTPDQDVIAWARHTIGQPAGFTGTLKLVNIFALGSVRASSGSETTSDIMLQFEVFNGTTRQASTYIERMRPNICTDSPSASAARCSDHIGIPNPPAVSAKVVTLRPESPDFNTMGLPKNVQDVTLRVRRTHTISVKPVDASLSALTKVAGSSGTDTATLFGGDVKIAPKGYINGNGQLEIASTNALPCELLSMVCSLEVSQ